MNNHSRSTRGQESMPDQHSIATQPRGESEQPTGIIVPLDLPEFKILSQHVQADGSIEVHVIAHSEREACPQCKSMCVKIHDIRQRGKRDIALRGHQIRLVVAKRRFRCLLCQRTFTESDSACGRYKRTTKRFREELAKRAMHQPLAHIAQEAGVGPRFVQDCFEALTQETLAKEGRTLDETAKLPTPRFLGIDEFARRKGHTYETIICDLEARRIVEISAGRTLQDVQTVLERFDEPDAVTAVSMDMSASFRPAVQLCFPHACIVVDHFHVIQHVMKAFKKIVSSWAHKTEGKLLLQGKQHLFLLAQEELTEEQAQERGKLAEALPLLEAAWQLKEALRTWYATASAATAAEGLDQWIEQVQHSEFDPLRKCLSAFVTWRQEILAFFQFLPTRLSNGFVEGKNNRTKAIIRQGYGYRNRQHLRLHIFLADVA
jgi:transposase